MKKILVVIFAALLGISAFAAKPKVQNETVTFKVHLHCQNCVKKVQENISFEKGVVDLKCSLENQTVAVTFNPEKTSAEKLSKAIQKLGYEVSGTVDCCGDKEKCECGHEHGHDHEHGEKHENCSCGSCK